LSYVPGVRKLALAILSLGVLSVLATACGSSSPEVIDVVFYGTGFQSYGGLQASVHTEGETNVATITTGGSFLAGTWVDLDRGSNLTVDYFVDVNGDQACDASDKAWTVARAAEATTSNQAVILSLTHDSSYNPAACSSF
jgi:hypothetical protein